jgi:hypothetical protein
MMTRRQAVATCAAALTSFAAETKIGSAPRVSLERLPEGGLQPQVAVDDQGSLHLLYYTGDPRNGDVFYVRASSPAIRVNSQPGSAIAAGTIRGAQLALGKGGRAHVAWNGSKPDGPLNPESGKHGASMLYAHLDNAGAAFEPQRNLMLHSFGLDGGGSIAADRAGNVYVAWHGIAESEAKGPATGEARRRVWVAKSEDDGRTFSPEAKAWPEETGACACCGMKIFADRRNTVYALYRSATESVHRNIYLLISKDRGRSFQGRLLHEWNINACPMSSMDFAANGKTVVGAWETGGQVFWARLDRGQAPVSAPGEGKGRKHPRVAVNQSGETLLVWTEGTGWQKGGALAYQIFDPAGRPSGERNQVPGIPAWSFAAALAKPDNSFSIVY